MKTFASTILSRYTIANGSALNMAPQKPLLLPHLRKRYLRGEDPRNKLVGDGRRLSFLSRRASWSTSGTPKTSVGARRESSIRKG